MYSESSKLYADLQRFGHRLVLAESCTAGRIASELGLLPGISDCFCGSFVVYRNDSKARWLGIQPALLNDPAIGPVSPLVTDALALSALSHTPEATIAAAITGHLGPGAPPALDGIVYCAFAFRDPSIPGRCDPYRLVSPAPRDVRDIERRQSRQAEAAEHLMKTLSQLLEQIDDEGYRPFPHPQSTGANPI